MATDNSYTREVHERRVWWVTRLAVLAVVAGIIALPLFHAWQAFGMAWLFWLGAFFAALTLVSLVTEYAFAAAPSLFQRLT